LNTAFAIEGSISTYQKQSRWQTCRNHVFLNWKWSSAYGAAKELSNCRWKFTQIIERHQSLNENPVLTNSVTEIFAQKTSYQITIRFKMTTWLQTWLTTRMSLKNKKAALQWILFSLEETWPETTWISTILEKE
jgi:hypothetical protein